MKKQLFAALPLAALLALSATPVTAAKKKQTQPIAAAVAPAPETVAAKPSPNEIVAAAPASDWTAIAQSDLLVMDMAADAKGKERRVVIQLMPAPFSQGWIGNIRKLAAAHWWDGTAIVRVQDNYVTQWGDPTEKKALPEGLAVVPESKYGVSTRGQTFSNAYGSDPVTGARVPLGIGRHTHKDPFASYVRWDNGFAVAGDYEAKWPIHCYGMVGVARDMSPKTGTGAELYTVIGHAPRHLDRNIALVGRIIEGMEHMSSLPRGTGALGFYEKPEDRTAILSVRLGTYVAGLSPYEYLSTESESFAKYAEARANRRDPFFITPAGGADICNIPVPVRRKEQ